MRYFQALALALLLYAPVSAEPVALRDGSVSFLCADPGLPLKYAKGKDGSYTAIPYDFDECPPPFVYVKRGGTYSPCPFNSSGLSASHRLPRAASAHSNYYVKDTGAGGTFELFGDGRAQSGGDAHSKKPAEAKKSAETKDAEWRQIAEAPPADGHDYLLCLFQPKPLTKWYPPAVARIDISPSAFPKGRCLFVNCSPLRVFVQVGAASQPIALAPSGGSFIANGAADSNGNLLVKVAAGNAEGMSVAFNREMEIPAGSRTVFAITLKRVPQGAPPRATVKYYFLNDNPPALMSEPDKKSSVGAKSST